jgi:hypothetical protein
MGFLIGIAIIAAITVLPVMLAAKFLKANNTGFMSCLIAVVLSAAASNYIENYFSGSPAGLVLAFAFTAVVFSLILGAKYLQSAGIAILAVVIQYVGAIGLAGIGVAFA